MIKCFWLEPTDQVSLGLRRYARHDDVCPISVYHNASVTIGQDHKGLHSSVHGDSWDHADQRWPSCCQCGYVFKEDDQWQFNPDTLYKRSDTGELVTLQNAPAGAMMHAEWLSKWKSYKVGEDGITLQVKTPDGWWCVDGPSYNGSVSGPGWTRTGIIPNVSAYPSILMTNYHGWLRDGYLVSC